jgi:hypothetical protein
VTVIAKKEVHAIVALGASYCRHMDEDDESRDVVADLQSELEEREQQLQMAAEFGQGLLEKNTALEEENAELRQENAACIAKVEDVEWRFRELEANVARLNEMLQEKQVALDRAEAELEAQSELTREADAAASELADANDGHGDGSGEAVAAAAAAAAKAAAAEQEAQQKLQLDAEAEQAILEETDRRLQAEQSAMKLRQALERREEELGRENAKVAEAMAERDELSEKSAAERERCNALQVRLAEMERQLMVAIAAEEASSAAPSGAHTLDMSLAAAGNDSMAGPSLLEMMQDEPTPMPALQLDETADAQATPTPTEPSAYGTPLASPAIASPVVAATVALEKQPAPKPAPPSKETIALQGMLAAVQRSQQHAESLVATENAQEWEGLSELFTAALNLKLTDEYSISIMKRNIERGSHDIPHFMGMISGWLEKWAEEEAEKRRQKQKRDGKWAELEELCAISPPSWPPFNFATNRKIVSSSCACLRGSTAGCFVALFLTGLLAGGRLVWSWVRSTRAPLTSNGATLTRKTTRKRSLTSTFISICGKQSALPRTAEGSRETARALPLTKTPLCVCGAGTRS